MSTCNLVIPSDQREPRDLRIAITERFLDALRLLGMTGAVVTFRQNLPHRVCGAADLSLLLLNFFHHEALENIAFLDVVELQNAHTALIAGGNLLGSILEALQ